MSLAMYSTRNGVILIDEVESGVHYSVLEKLWEVIDEFSQEFSVQVFATTHSYECLIAAHKVFSKKEKYDFKLYRLERELLISKRPLMSWWE